MSTADTRPEPRQVIARCLLGSLTLMVVGLALFEVDSMNYRMVKAGGLPALASLGVMLALGTLGLADTIVNDVAPARYRFVWAEHRRHLLWSLLGCTYMGYAFVLLHGGGGGYWLVGIWVIYAAGCMAIAFKALRYRHEGAEVLS